MSRKPTRDVASYLESAKELAKFIPALKKYKKRKRLTRWEKAAISRKENIVRYTDYLIPVTKKQARELKDILYSPQTTVKTGKNRGKIIYHHGIQAIQLRNVGKDARIIKKVDQHIFVVSNGRTWVYWRLPNTRPKTIAKYGEQAFTTPEAYDIERVIELARTAFKNPETKGVYLWGESGRVGNPMPSLRQFIEWVATDYAKYTNTDRWVNGIAILVADVDERISTSEWISYGTKQEDAIEYAERQERRKRRRRRRK